MASEFDILRKRPLSGPLSSRSLTSESGRMKNASRSLLRKGFAAQAGQMAMGAELAKMQEIQDRGGRSIRSADREMTEARYALRAANAAAIQRERSRMPEAGGTTGTTTQPPGGTATPPPGGTSPTTTIPKPGSTSPPPGGTTTPPSGGTSPTTTIPKPGSTPQPSGGTNIPQGFRTSLEDSGGRTGTINGVEVGDKESVIRRVMEESATSDESRRSILDRINRERASVGQKPIEIDWAADVGSRDIAASDAATARKAKEAGATTQRAIAREDLLRNPMGPSRQTAQPPTIEPTGPPRGLANPPQPMGPPKPPPLLKRPTSAPSLVSRSDVAKRESAAYAKRDSELRRRVTEAKRREKEASAGNVPSWLQGTLVGKGLEILQKPMP